MSTATMTPEQTTDTRQGGTTLGDYPEWREASAILSDVARKAREQQLHGDECEHER